MLKTTKFLMLVTALLVGLCCPALAQTSGSLSGEVKDEKQAVITGATVTLRNVSTNETRTAQTNADGRYHFTGMPVGSYELTVESTGFAKHQQSGITLALNQNAVVDVTMKPGAVQEIFERDTDNEMGRQQFTSDEEIGPGRTKELTVTITSPPTRTVSVTSLNLEERKRFTEKIEVVRVQYADGRIWEALPSPSSPQSPSLVDLSWMSGDWQTAPGERRQIEEHWTTVAGGSMMGMSRTVAGEKTVEFEYLRIEQRADGIYYVAHPNARCPATDFKLTKSSTTEAVFENPQHDFPKRITYRKSGDDSLTATIDGGEGSKATSFSFRRMK